MEVKAHGLSDYLLGAYRLDFRLMAQRGRYKQSDPFYHTAAWKAARLERLRRDNWKCTVCMAAFMAGGTRPRDATMVHHVIPIKERPDLALDIDNLRSLCDICHNREHPEKGGQGRAASRTKSPPMRVIKI